MHITVYFFKFAPSYSHQTIHPLSLLICSFPDVDECSLYTGRCKEPAKCVNIPGTYECQCPPGFKYNFTSQTCDGETSVYCYCNLMGVYLSILDCIITITPPPVNISPFFGRCGRVWVQRVPWHLYKHSGQLRVLLWRSPGSSFGRGSTILWNDPCLRWPVQLQTLWDALPGGAVCRPAGHLSAFPTAREHKVSVNQIIQKIYMHSAKWMVEINKHQLNISSSVTEW